MKKGNVIANSNKYINVKEARTSYKNTISPLMQDVGNIPTYTFNERYTITKENHSELYDAFTSIAKSCNVLFNNMMHMQRETFMKTGNVIFYQDLNHLISNLVKGNPLKKCTFIPSNIKKVVDAFKAVPYAVALGTIYDLCDKWYRFMDANHEFQMFMKHNMKYFEESLIKKIQPRLPRIKNNSNRRTFTIDPNKLKVIKNPQYRKNERRHNYKHEWRNTIENYPNLIVLPEDSFPKHLHVDYSKMVIPTHLNKSSIVEIRITPNRGIYNVDIRYRKEKLNSDCNMMARYDRHRIAGIDFGIDNLMAIANNVGASPLLFKAKNLVSKNAYYNEMINALINNGGNKHHNSNTKKIHILNKRRTNIMRNDMHHMVNVLIKYLNIIHVKTLVLGVTNTVLRGFTNNPNFLPIDFKYLIKCIEKQCRYNNINCYQVDEYHTSSTSILDNQRPCFMHAEKYRRINNRLYMTQNFGIVNCDINSAMQIIIKKFPDAFNRVFRKLNIDSIISNTIYNQLPYYFKGYEEMLQVPYSNGVYLDTYTHITSRSNPDDKIGEYHCYLPAHVFNKMPRYIYNYYNDPRYGTISYSKTYSYMPIAYGITNAVASILSYRRVFVGTYCNRETYCQKMISKTAAPKYSRGLVACMLTPVCVENGKINSSELFSKIINTKSYIRIGKDDTDSLSYKSIDKMINDANYDRGISSYSFPQYIKYR